MTGVQTCALPISGYWEYLLDEAIYTAPATVNWQGAALINKEGKLLGVGSLVVNDAIGGKGQVPGNMFVPIDLLKPILGENLPHVMTFHALAHALVHPREDLIYDDRRGENPVLSTVVQSIVDDLIHDDRFGIQVKALMLEIGDAFDIIEEMTPSPVFLLNSARGDALARVDTARGASTREGSTWRANPSKALAVSLSTSAAKVPLRSARAKASRLASCMATERHSSARSATTGGSFAGHQPRR